MSDTPTTAEQAAADGLREFFGWSSTRSETVARIALDYVRSSPSALADLNGGEWVDVRLATPEQYSKASRNSWTFIFVPREDR